MTHAEAIKHRRYEEWYLAMTLRATFMCFEAWLWREESRQS